MKDMSIRRKLYKLILIALVPLCVLQILGIVYRYTNAVDAELDVSREFAEMANTALLNYLKDLWNLEFAVGTAIIQDEHFPDPGRIERILKAMEYDYLEELSWIKPDGTIVASTLPEAKQLDMKNQECFQAILRGQKESVSDITISRVTGKHIILVSRGFYQQQTLIGVLVAGLKADALESILPKRHLAKTWAFGFADRKGVIAFHSGAANLLHSGKKVSADSPVWRSLQGETIITHQHTSSLSGERRMGISIPFPELGWATFSTVSVAEVMNGIMLITFHEILLLIILVTISFWAAIKVADQILHPVGKLQQAAIAISQGDLSARTKIEGQDELAMTGQIFDQMAERIQRLETGREIFLQTAAHELRNPMAGVKGILALVRRKIASGKSLGQVEEKFGIMEKEIDRLSSLLNQILEAFRIQREEGLLSLNLQRVNIVEIVQAALTPFQNMVSLCHFTLDLKTQKPLWVLADLQRLEDVFRNLFSNANKYSLDGGEVIVTVAKVEDSALISVKDSGIGIPPDHLHRIFECFHRAGNLKSNDPGGIGLGLFICEKIVLSHGGTIWVESVEGEGSTFFVQIPLYREAGDTNEL